jgi:hypothetical protein
MGFCRDFRPFRTRIAGLGSEKCAVIFPASLDVACRPQNGLAFVYSMSTYCVNRLLKKPFRTRILTVFSIDLGFPGRFSAGFAGPQSR